MPEERAIEYKPVILRLSPTVRVVNSLPFQFWNNTINPIADVAIRITPIMIPRSRVKCFENLSLFRFSGKSECLLEKFLAITDNKIV